MRRENKGFVLVAAIIILVLLSSLGLACLSLLSTDINIALDTLRSAKAFFLAEAGMQYIMEDLSVDSDWSDNPDILSEPMAGGEFSVQYLAKTPANATIKFTGKDGDVTRKFTANFSRYSPAFDHVIYIGGRINDSGATNLNIVGDQHEQATGLPVVDYAYYEDIADQRIYRPGRTYVFNGGVYYGIWYIEGSVTIRSNVTIYGSVIATESINMNNNSNITIRPTLPYPALVANNDINCRRAINLTVNGLTYAGTDGSGTVILRDTRTVSISGTIIAADVLRLQDSNHVDILYNRQDYPPGFSGIPAYSVWQEVN
ncbi:MAG: hypothetical protein WC510_07500 [Candidatus Omnitrophota bacterium]